MNNKSFVFIGLLVLILIIGMALKQTIQTPKKPLIVKEHDFSYQIGSFEEQPKGTGRIKIPEPERFEING